MTQQVVNSLGDLAHSVQLDSSPNNALLDSLSNIFQNFDHASQSHDQFEFFDLLRFLTNQISSTDDLPDISNSPQIGDFLRGLNLFNNSDQNESIISELISVLFQSINFEDLLQIINSNFHAFSRFRQPFQDFIRNSLQCSDWTIENIRNSTNNFIAGNYDSLITIIVSCF